MTGFVIRHAEPRDIDAIQVLIKKAFDGPLEAKLVEDLAGDGDLFLSLVAESRGEIIGHIAFSPLVSKDGTAKGQALAPLAVAPLWQRQGIGIALVTEAHGILRRMGQDFALVLGDPAYYGRLGYTTEAAKRFQAAYDGPYLQALILSDAGHKAHGALAYAPAFARLEGGQ